MRFNWLIAIIVILFSIQFNVSIIRVGSNNGDIDSQQNWGNNALERGVSWLYSDEAGDQKTDYPPLYLYVLKLNAWTQQKIFGHLQTGTWEYKLTSKIVPLFCNLLIGIFIFLYLKNERPEFAVFGMALYLLNLATIYDVSYWGQVDSVNTLFMFLSILSIVKGKYVLSSWFFVLSVLTKVQSIVILPVISVVLFKELVVKNFQFKKLSLVFLVNTVTILIIFTPFIMNNIEMRVVDTVFSSVGKYAHVTANAYNIWYLVSPKEPQNWRLTAGDLIEFHGFSYRDIGMGLFIIYSILVAYQVLRTKDKDDILLGASGMTYAFFLLPTEIHERYMFPFFALFSLVAVKKVKYVVIYVIVTLLFLFNLMMVLNFNASVIEYSVIQRFLGFMVKKFSFIWVASGVAILNILMFIYFNKISILRDLTLNFKSDISTVFKFLKNALTNLKNIIHPRSRKMKIK